MSRGRFFHAEDVVRAEQKELREVPPVESGEPRLSTGPLNPATVPSSRDPAPGPVDEVLRRRRPPPASASRSRSCGRRRRHAHGDGGGRVRAITSPVNGRVKVARMLVSGLWAAEAFGGWSLSQVQVNGQPGAMVRDPAGKLIAVMVLDIADGRIQALPSIANPDQLRHLDHGATP